MPIEMSPYKLIDLPLRARVQILELMHRLEFHHIQPIRKHTVRLALKQMLRLIRSDVRDGGEDVRAMGS